MKLFQQGHWVEENHVEWDHTYDISTPEKAKKIGMAAFQLYLNWYHKGGSSLPAAEYTLEMHKKTWRWKGGEDRLTGDGHAWKHFDNQKEAHEKSASRVHAAALAFVKDDGEALIEFLNGFDDIKLTFQVITVDEEFIVPENDVDEDDEEDYDD